MFIGNNAHLLGAAFGNNKTIASSGDRLWRHPSGMGTVIESAELQGNVLILDAKYRSYAAFINVAEVDSGYYGVNGSLYGLPQVQQLPDLNTSRYNCDKWLSSNKNIYAVKYCRSVYVTGVGGVGCDLPNIQILKRMWINRQELDEMDPSLTEAANLALVNWFYNPSSQIVGAWSSTFWGLQGNIPLNCSINYKGELTRSPSSGSNIVQHANTGAVTPILEL